MGNKVTLEKQKISVSGFRNWFGDGVALWWLGQAGFLLRYKNTTIIIDAYLSDALALKYKDQYYPHQRMMPPPIAPDQLSDIDFFICSHSHSDHMDPGLIPVIRDNNPNCRFIIPEAARGIGIERGIPPESLIGIDAGSETKLTGEVSVSNIPSAHETLTQDAEGHHSFLGFVFGFGGYTVYHPGDCLPYTGLDDWLRPFDIDLALMPVTGRKEELSQRGIAGNFNLSQARNLVVDHNIRYMIPHHYGMFDFNTVDRDELDKMIVKSGIPDRIFPAETEIMYQLAEGDAV
jgi:L-ascorbate metabolism protein UlaG (beta-lactamase superfamily)